ncbi:MAG: hypothetical protein AAGA31_03560 [Bacteroidota bacterium]
MQSTLKRLTTNNPIRRMASTDRKVLAICIAAAFIFWLILNLSREYPIRREVQLTYDIAPDRVLVGQIPETIEAEVTGNGWDLIWESLRPGPLPVTIELGEGESLRLTKPDLTKKIRRKLSTGDLTVSDLNFESITLLTTPKEGKRVPVVSALQVDFSSGYLALNPPVFSPDSITLSGATDALEEVSVWPTQEVRFTKVEGTIEAEVALTEPIEGVALSQDKVVFYLPVEPSIQRTISVPIRIINAPEATDFRLIPEKVDLQVTLPQSAYHAIRPGDFRLVADLAGFRNSEGHNSVPISLVGKPAVAVGVFFSPRAAEYYLVN